MRSIPGFALLCALLTCCCAPADAADVYPSHIVKFLVPQAPGGATDVFARKLGQLLSEKWGQPVIVENRAGAAGVVGTEAVARSAPDGYTLLVTYAGSQAVNPSLPIKTLQDFVALARQRPGALTFASSGNGSINQLLGEMLKLEARIDI